MMCLKSAQDLARLFAVASSQEALEEALSAASNEMGFQFFALSQHPRHGVARDDLRLHNYPVEWEQSYDRRRLGLSDPIHRASHRTACGFRWRDVRDIVPFCERDEAMLAEAITFGIVDGYTIPANVPGEPCGSVTFATKDGRPFPETMLLYAQAFGSLAFQAARRLDNAMPGGAKAGVTDRQLEIVKWVGKDKSDWEIAQILGVSRTTVTKHIRDICQRVGTYKRTSLPLRAVYDGLLCFSDIFR